MQTEKLMQEMSQLRQALAAVTGSVGVARSGSAWGEAALLLSSGKKGCRSALPSSSIMLKQPIQQFTNLQATDIQIKRLELRKIKDEYCDIMGKNCGKTAEVLDKDMSRSLYLTPDEAVDYGLIDNVLREEDENIMSKVPEWQ